MIIHKTISVTLASADVTDIMSMNGKPLGGLNQK